MATRKTPPNDEQAFLSAYDPSIFPRPSVAVDLVVTSVDAEGELLLLLVKRAEHPFRGHWSLPGGFLREHESVPKAAARVLREKTGLDRVTIDELGSFSEPHRDPRTWVLSLAHLALVPPDKLEQARPGPSTDEARFFRLRPSADPPGFSLESRAGGDAPKRLAFDHDAIVAAAIARMRARVETTTLAFDLLPERFTLPEAQRVVEAILGRTLDKAAFRTKVLSLGLVRPTAEERRGKTRPARLYVAAKGWDVV